MATVTAVVLVIGLAACQPYTPYTWGANARGQLGVGSTSSMSTPGAAGGDEWRTLAAGNDMTCGIHTERSLWCWGSNADGQLGDGTTTDRTSPVQVAPGQAWKSVSPGSTHTCALRDDASLWCWGANGVGQLGVGTTTASTTPVRVGSDLDWASVRVGKRHTCATKTSGSLWCWGANDLGQLGRGTTTPSGPDPGQVGTAAWLAVSAFGDHTCGIQTTLSLWCWGANSAGQLGDGTTTGRAAPVAVASGTTWSAIGAGESHTCAVRGDRTLWCWGDNSAGQLGNSTVSPSPAPTQAGAATDWAQVSAGGQHTCGIRADSTLWCWGSNDEGQLGDPAIAGVAARVPSRIGTDSDWVSLSLGSDHTVGLREPSDPPPPPNSLGIVVNGDLETPRVDDPTQPEAWHQVRWGTNTATFSYPTGDAHGGQRSARVDVSAYTDGGATWAFDSQPVTAMTTYLVTGWYRSNRTTELLAVFTTIGGGVEFRWLADLPPSPTAWASYTRSTTAPAGAVSVTLYQSLTATGFVQVDDVRVEPNNQPPPTFLGLVPNGDLERADPNGQPTYWDPVRWGDNTASFTYPMTGAHSGSRHVRLDVTRYVDGGATWSFDPQPVATEQSYLFSTWYRSDQPAEMLAVMTRGDGSTAFQWLGVAPPSSTWRLFFAVLTTPTDVVDVRVFQSLTSVGWIESDDVSIQPFTPQSFDRPLVTLTFDDGYASHATVALPKLQSAGLPATFYLASGDLGTPAPPDYMTHAQVGQLVAAGMEIGSHSVTHPMLTTLSSAQQDAELGDSQAALQALTGQPIDSFAVPFGDYDAALVGKIMQRYATHRTVDDGFNYRDTLDFTRIKAKMVLETTTPAQVQAWVQQAQVEGLWLVLVFHDIVPSPPTEYDMTPAMFDQIIDVVVASGVAVESMGQAHGELAGQPPISPPGGP